MGRYIYPKDTPVDEPTSPETPKKPAVKSAIKLKGKPYVYPDSTPVADSAGMKRGGYVRAADGIAQRGKTRGTMLCSGGMTKRK